MNKIIKCFKLIFLDYIFLIKIKGMLYYLNILLFVFILIFLLNVFVIELFILDLVVGLLIKFLVLLIVLINIFLKVVENLCYY